ncbi:MAG TPA: lamin tail domain-containing protein [Chitinophagaceae bacterium]
MKQVLLLILTTLRFVLLPAQNRYDIVIGEIMVDQSPQVGLPNNEWIELKNVSSSPVNLQNWRIGKPTGQSGPMPNYILQPDSFVIVCTGSAIAAMSAFGPAISVTGFPSLDNDGDQLFLKSPGGMIIHAIDYSSAWYQNELKRDGGWTLEMIDPKNPCAGSSNWKASVDPTGGTPGKKNSVDAVNNDQAAPLLKRSYTIDNLNIVAVFDEPIDSLIASNIANYSINGLMVTNALPLSPLFNTVRLTLNSPLQLQTVYELTVSNIKDCKDNIITAGSKAKAGLPEDPVALDIVINEILFNPRPTAEDFVELYNKSNKVFDASKLGVANRNSSNVISSIRQLSVNPWLIFPEDHIVVTIDPGSLAREYLVKNPDCVFIVSSSPSMPDDKGFAILLDQQGNVVDEVNYNKNWHFKLLHNDEGVSLERIDPNGPSQDAVNWHSAASTAGYGTPTYKNSQHKLLQSIPATIAIIPKVFSPDNDGRDDIATIQYKITEPGYVANVTIYDAAGRPVRHLVRNGTMGLEGYWSWDGLGDKENKLSAGAYIILTDLFNLQGWKDQFKNVVVLAKRMN